LLPGYLAAEYIKHMINKETQVQPAGVDLTIAEVYSFGTPGLIGFKKRELPRVVKIEPSGDMYFLERGFYKIVFNEAVYVPKDCAGICLPRSSLLRSGVSVSCALWDPGYYGRGEALMIVGNPHGVRLEVNARVAQLVFIRVNPPPRTLYSGVYQGERLREEK